MTPTPTKATIMLMTTTRRQRWRRRDGNDDDDAMLKWFGIARQYLFPVFSFLFISRSFLKPTTFGAKKSCQFFPQKILECCLKSCFFPRKKFSLLWWINLLSSDRDPVCFFDLMLSGNFWHLLVGYNSYDFKRKKKIQWWQRRSQITVPLAWYFVEHIPAGGEIRTHERPTDWSESLSTGLGLCAVPSSHFLSPMSSLTFITTSAVSQFQGNLFRYTIQPRSVDWISNGTICDIEVGTLRAEGEQSEVVAHFLHWMYRLSFAVGG